MRTLRSLHAWVGAGLALGLMFMGLTGTLTALRPEMIAASVPAARAAAPGPASLGPALEAFDAAGSDRVKAVKFSPQGLGVHRVFLTNGASVLIDGEGREVARWRGNRRVEELVLALHRELLFGKAGNFVVGLLAIGGLGVTVLGLAIWLWPRPRLDLRVWPATTARRDMFNAHQNLGALLGLFLLVQLTTSLVMAYGGPARAVLGVEAPVAPPAVAPAGPTRWTVVLAAAQARIPDAEVRRVITPAGGVQPFTVNMRTRGEWGPEGDTVVFVDGRGTVVGVSRNAERSLGTRVYASLKALHTGDYGGGPGRLGAGVIGVGMALLGGFGLWSFVTGPRLRRRAA
jgi:uncharacterized iron-regulated membrane protein